MEAGGDGIRVDVFSASIWKLFSFGLILGETLEQRSDAWRVAALFNLLVKNALMTENQYRYQTVNSEWISKWKFLKRSPQ